MKTEEVKGYTEQVDENQSNGQADQENNNNVSLQYPVGIKQNSELSNEAEDPIIKAKLRNGFIRKVFMIVACQLLITFCFILLCQIKLIKNFISKHQNLCAILVTTSIIWLIVAICIVSCNKKLARKVPHNYILLFSITLSESVICISASFLYSLEIVIASIVLTIAASFGIIIYTTKTKKDLSVCRMGLMAFASQLLFFGFLNAFFRFQFMNLLYSFLGTAFVAMYLVYDVQLILGKFGMEYSIDDYIFASMELYIDIIRLFLEILRIVGKLQKNK